MRCVWLIHFVGHSWGNILHWLLYFGSCIFVPQKCETCLVHQTWNILEKLHGVTLSGHTRSNFDQSRIPILWKKSLAVSSARTFRMAPSKEDVIYVLQTNRPTWSNGKRLEMKSLLSQAARKAFFGNSINNCIQLGSKEISSKSTVTSCCVSTHTKTLLKIFSLTHYLRHCKTAACFCLLGRTTMGELPCPTTHLLSQLMKALLKGRYLFWLAAHRTNWSIILSSIRPILTWIIYFFTTEPIASLAVAVHQI